MLSNCVLLLEKAKCVQGPLQLWGACFPHACMLRPRKVFALMMCSGRMCSGKDVKWRDVTVGIVILIAGKLVGSFILIMFS